MGASTTDDNAVYEQSDMRMCQLINIRGTSLVTRREILDKETQSRLRRKGKARCQER